MQGSCGRAWKASVSICFSDGLCSRSPPQARQAEPSVTGMLFILWTLLQGHKLKESLTPVLNLLTESARVHRQTRKFLKAKVRGASAGSRVTLLESGGQQTPD